MNPSWSKLSRIAAVALALCATSCESGTDVPPPVAVSLSVDLGGAFTALSKVDRLRLLVSRASGGTALDTTLVVAGSIVLSGIEVPLQTPNELLKARVELFAGSEKLFEGESELQAESGSTVAGTVPMNPIVGSLILEGPLPVFVAIGDRWLLEGEALFMSGDTVPGARLEWTSADSTVAAVVAGSQLEARGEGVTTVTATLAGKSASLETRVEAKVASLTIEPADVSVPIGFESRVEAVARDANGNPLEREATWTSNDEAVATIDEGGVIRGVTLGETSVIAEVEDVATTADVEVTPAPPAIDDAGAPSPGTRSAQLSAVMTPNGAATSVRFEWSEDEAFTAPQLGADQAIGDGLEPVDVNEALIRLTPSSTYYMRVVATNDYGQTVTDVVSFATADPTGGFVDGLVQAEGQPVQGAVVQLDGGPTVTTNAEGAYAFDDVALGSHQVTLTDVPTGVVFETTTATGEITQVGQVLALHFDGEFLRDSRIFGGVRASGLAVPGVTVTLTGPDQASTTTDEGGNYDFPGVRAGDYVVSIDGYDETYLSFPNESLEVSVDVAGTQEASFLGVDSDLLTVEAYGFYGIDGVKPGVAPAQGATFAVYPTEADANAGQNLMGSGVADENGVARILVRKREDTGPSGGASDNTVWTGVAALPAPNTRVQADGVLPVAFTQADAMVSASDTTDFQSGTVKLRLQIKTIGTGAPDSPLFLHLWGMSMWDDTTSAAIGSTSSSNGTVTFTLNQNVTDLPVRVFIRANSSQPFAYGAAWSQVPKAAQSAQNAGRHISYFFDGTQSPTTTINVGTEEITYQDMHVYTGVHHEVDDATSTVYLTGGDDLANATSFTIKLFQNGSLVDTKPVRSDGNINAFRNVPSFVDATSITAETSDPSITIITSTSVSGQGNGGGTVGRIGSNGGYRHSLRVCGHRADTIIKECSGFAYKFNNTRIQGRVRQNGSGASGVTVTLKRCRVPQNLNQSTCVSYDGFERTDTTDGDGDYSFSSLLEGTYEVRASGGSPVLVKPTGKGDVKNVDLTVP